jgi:hypothetical protein
MKLYEINRYIGIMPYQHKDFIFANSEEEVLIILGYKLKPYDSIKTVCEAGNIMNPGVLVGKEITAISKEQLEKVKII